MSVNVDQYRRNAGVVAIVLCKLGEHMAFGANKNAIYQLTHNANTQDCRVLRVEQGIE